MKKLIEIMEAMECGRGRGWKLGYSSNTSGVVDARPSVSHCSPAASPDHVLL